jgi:hypothetical protein
MSERGGERPYLSVCAIYRNEAPYLREWIEFHRLVGIERFFLYNNESTDNHRDVLAPYLEDGSVVLYDWPFFPGQMDAYRDCLEKHSENARWMAFFDIDEFLFSPTGVKLPELLADFERWSGVVVHRATFGSSGLQAKPPGLVLENFVLRTNDPLRNSTFKSIVDPRQAYDLRNTESFIYREGFAVDENGSEAPADPTPGRTTWARFRINHYVTKSIEEWREKITKPTAHTNEPREQRIKHLPLLEEMLNQVDDHVIQAYIPALKEAIRRTDQRSGDLAETS